MTLVCFCRFNTSHVTLYHFSLEHLFIVWTRFNTSHVTLYPVNHSGFSSLEKFQYISCYSLSTKGAWHIHIIVKFQYISCYSLSKEDPGLPHMAIRFNTSHVTLYPSFYRLFFF